MKSYDALQSPPAGVILEPIPEPLCTLLEAILRDIQGLHPAHLEVGYAEAAFGDQPYLFLRVNGAVDLVGVEVSSGDQAYLAVRIAESAQTALAESGAGWAEPRPECIPGHAHPPEPQIWEGVPSWVCPHELRLVSVIGRRYD